MGGSQTQYYRLVLLRLIDTVGVVYIETRRAHHHFCRDTHDRRRFSPLVFVGLLFPIFHYGRVVVCHASLVFSHLGFGHCGPSPVLLGSRRIELGGDSTLLWCRCCKQVGALPVAVGSTLSFKDEISKSLSSSLSLRRIFLSYICFRSFHFFAWCGGVQ